ncbi:MAG: trimethylamine methyltransferase family protein, partial [Chloroflexota bacterium]
MIVRSNAVQFASPQFRKLSDTQRDRIHQASLEILERTGVTIALPEALALVKKAGAIVAEDGRVRIPSRLVDWAVNLAPKRVVLADRHGRRVMPMEADNVFYGPGSDCPNV